MKILRNETKETCIKTIPVFFFPSTCIHFTFSKLMKGKKEKRLLKLRGNAYRPLIASN